MIAPLRESSLFEPPMNFVVHFSFPAFFRTLAGGSTVYSVAYVESSRQKPLEAATGPGLVLLTSDAGVEGGMVRVLQIRVTNNATDLSTKPPIDLAEEASEKISEFLSSKGVRVQEGVLLTVGLQDALRYWGQGTEYSLTELAELFSTGKDATLA